MTTKRAEPTSKLMKKFHIILLSMLVLNMIGMLWWFSDTQIIKRQTKDLAASLSMTQSDSPSSRALKHQKLTHLLAAKLKCTIEVPGYSHTFNRSELTEAHLALLNHCKSSSAKASAISISFENDTTAMVTLSLDLSVIEKSDKTHRETCTAELTWQEDSENQWRLIRVSLNK